jgi:ribosome-associated heat shock protein Hsp15
MSGEGEGIGPDGAAGGAAGGGEERIRLDKWLWFARFFKSRSLAARLVEAGGVRMAGAPVTKAHQTVRPGDVLTFAQGGHVRAVRVRAVGTRRGPAAEAQALYEDLAPPSAETRLPR